MLQPINLLKIKVKLLNLTNSKVTMNKPYFKANLNWFSNAYYNNTCWYGKCVISTDGNVYPCEFENNIIYGNIRQQSIIDIIRDCKIDKYWYLDFTKIEYCKDCEFRFACRDCRPLAYAQKGNILEKNPRCKYNPYLGIWEDD